MVIVVVDVVGGCAEFGQDVVMPQVGVSCRM